MDEIEHFATLRRQKNQEKGVIVYLSDEVEISIVDAIRTWEAKNGAEYLILESGLEIRMDKVVSVYGVRASGADD